MALLMWRDKVKLICYIFTAFALVFPELLSWIDATGGLFADLVAFLMKVQPKCLIKRLRLDRVGNVTVFVVSACFVFGKADLIEFMMKVSLKSFAAVSRCIEE